MKAPEGILTNCIPIELVIDGAGFAVSSAWHRKLHVTRKRTIKDREIKYFMVWTPVFWGWLRKELDKSGGSPPKIRLDG
jgi:hypothetical protein